MKNIQKIFILAALVGMMNIALSADFFESLLQRLVCYQQEQPGCNEEFIDKYKNVSWSYTNTTRANTFFFMFTNKSPEKPELMHKCGGRLPPNTTFNPNCPTEVFIPGYVSGICNFAIFRELKNERLKSGCYNVLLVDYMWGNIPDLAIAKKNNFIVAEQMAIIVNNLKSDYNLSSSMFILTGHSFGAHVAGMTSQRSRVGKILGIEPAGGPYTENTPLDERLDEGDADCVVVLHCNGGPCLPRYFGVGFTCGTVDFWINGGKEQPACYEQTLKAFAKQDYIFGLFNLLPPACNHFKCLQYYRNSMNNNKNCAFIGSQDKTKPSDPSAYCGTTGSNCLFMGINTCECLTDDKKNKSYYLDTTPFCPYCKTSGDQTKFYSCAAANVTGGVPLSG